MSEQDRRWWIELLCEWVSKQASDCVTETVGERASAGCVSERVSESESGGDCMSKWVGEWKSERQSEWFVIWID